LSRGESFLENLVFSDADAVGWSELDASTRHVTVSSGIANCTGFDLRAQLRQLLAPSLRAEVDRSAGGLRHPEPAADLRTTRSLVLRGETPPIYVPGLAITRQGPAFGNLGCLGLMADRVIDSLPCRASRCREALSERFNACAFCV
jgi:hypothetical protein